MEPVNIICLKWGTKFGVEYVNNLYNMVKRNITLPFRFICFTELAEGIIDGVEVMPLPAFEEPPPKYQRKCQCWRKLALFDKEYGDIKGKILMLDLDIVIIDNIDSFFTYSDKLAMPENWSKPGRNIGQGSVICYEMGQYPELLERWINNQADVYENYETEQVYLTQALGAGNFDWFPETWCRSFKDHCMPGGVLNSFVTPTHIPLGAKIIVFHGNPNPPEAIAGEWGIPVPWYKKWYKTVKPTAWIADYWC